MVLRMLLLRICLFLIVSGSISFCIYLLLSVRQRYREDKKLKELLKKQEELNKIEQLGKENKEAERILREEERRCGQKLLY